MRAHSIPAETAPYLGEEKKCYFRFTKGLKLPSHISKQTVLTLIWNTKMNEIRDKEGDLEAKSLYKCDVCLSVKSPKLVLSDI